MPHPLVPLSHLQRASEPERKFRLMEVVRRAMRERRYRPRTEEAYTAWIRRYIVFSGRRHPADLDETDVRAFLSDLAVGQRVSASTQNQALAAINFLYATVLHRPLASALDIVPARATRIVERLWRNRRFRLSSECFVRHIGFGAAIGAAAFG